MSCELTVTERFGARVELGHVNWQRHLPRRPELAYLHEHIPTVLRDPDVVVEQPDGTRHFYRGGLGTGKYSQLYIRVIVGYYGGLGSVKTAWFDPAIDVGKGTLLWMRQISRS